MCKICKDEILANDDLEVKNNLQINNIILYIVLSQNKFLKYYNRAY